MAYYTISPDYPAIVYQAFLRPRVLYELITEPLIGKANFAVAKFPACGRGSPGEMGRFGSAGGNYGINILIHRGQGPGFNFFRGADAWTARRRQWGDVPVGVRGAEPRNHLILLLLLTCCLSPRRTEPSRTGDSPLPVAGSSLHCSTPPKVSRYRDPAIRRRDLSIYRFDMGMRKVIGVPLRT